MSGTRPHDPCEADWEAEEREWMEAFDAVLERHDLARARRLLSALHGRLLEAGQSLDAASLNTPYRNTIPLSRQPAYPGDVALERRIENIIRWNAMAMVLRAEDSGAGVGGHIATYASTATLLEVGLHHVFRARGPDYGGDIVNVQPHASPGIYARALLEGRLGIEQVRNFRRQLQPGGGLPSYTHTRHMPELWPVPTASMGLSTPFSIYLARFARYLENRGLKPRNGGKVWTFIGDGESDEPEVLGTIAIAAREQLDNLVLVVNCNLQRLDGPVRGNGKIIQELERVFRGAGWEVIKVVWGSEWDAILQRDVNGVLQRRMEEAVDGDYQMYSVMPGAAVREHWVRGDPELAGLMASLSDEEIRTILRGGHDHRKIYAAYRRAAEARGRPTVILAKTIKGYGLGAAAEGKNTAHQTKKLSLEERRECARRFAIPLAAEEAERAELYLPPAGGAELEYLRRRREELGGFLPARSEACPALPAPGAEVFAELLRGSAGRPVSTTMAFVRLLGGLLRDPAVGKYVVPIVPDEARTFGMEGLFRQAGIYSPSGQNYRPVDADTLTPYRESAQGAILQEGICEAGAMASFLAAGSAYANHGLPMVPFYLFYSMFGFQRVGDVVWACGDMLCRGFLVGGTSGRTTLNGEGLQHQDGHSQLVAGTVPSLLSYDPAFAYEVAVIVREGLRRMYVAQDKVFYYLTVTNEPHAMPAMPGDEVAEGVIRGLYRFREAPLQTGAGRAVRLLSSGAILQQALAAQELLAEAGVAAEVWSAPSFNELQRDALACERWNRLHPRDPPRVPYVAGQLGGGPLAAAPVIAATDYVKAYPLAIAPWVPAPYTALGTDGYGLSESRADARDHFEVSARYIAHAALHGLCRAGALADAELAEWSRRHDIRPDKPDAATA